jgi:hypothetical protein
MYEEERPDGANGGEAEDPDDVVRLIRAPNEMQARLWQQLLQEQGIECRLVGDYLDIGFGTLSSLGPELWVHRRDAPRALALLEEHQSASSPEEKDDLLTPEEAAEEDEERDGKSD